MLAPFLMGLGAAKDDLSRRLGAIAGAQVADAAAMPLHWIYDTTDIRKKLNAGGDAAFYSPPSCPFYKYPEGENTPYGQQNRVFLSTLSAAPPIAGINWPPFMQEAYWQYYGPDNAPCHERQVPIAHTTGCYWDGSTKGFIANYQAGKRYPHVGANDTQGNAIVHMVPIVAALAGKPGMLGEVEKLIRVTQDTDKAVAFGLAGARVLSKVIGGSSLLQAVQSTAEDLKDPTREHPNSEDMALASGLEKMLGQLDRPTIDVTKEVGQSCDYPFGLWSGSHLAAQLSATATANATEAFMLGTRQLIEAGGDSGSRGAFVGALLGAVAGEQGIPAAWKQKYLHYDDVLTNAKKLLQAQVVV